MGSFRSTDSDSDDRSVVIKQEARSPSPQPHRSSSGKHNFSPGIGKNVDLIRAAAFRHQHSIEEYLKKRDLDIVDPTRRSSALEPDDLLNEDEEVWLIQCPHDVHVESLLGARLNLDGDRHKVKGKGDAATIEYSSETIGKSQRLVSLMCKTKGQRRVRHQMVSLMPAGIVRVQKKLQEPTDPEIVPTKPVRVPYPTDIKVRHPLHGIHYTNRTQLPEKVLESLSTAVAASNVARNQVVIKTEKDVDMEVEPSQGKESVKKAKKRKAPKDEPAVSDGDTVVKDEDAPRKAKRSKKIKVEESEDVNLDWLAAI